MGCHSYHNYRDRHGGLEPCKALHWGWLEEVDALCAHTKLSALVRMGALEALEELGALEALASHLCHCYLDSTGGIDQTLCLGQSQL